MKKWLCLVLSIGGLFGLFASVTTFALTQSQSKPSSFKSPIRAFHFVLHRMSTTEAIKLVDTVTAAGFNTIVVVIKDGIRLDHATWKPATDAWSKKEFIDWVGYAKNRGLNVIPELKLLTHQQLLLQDKHSALMFNSHTYDPRNQDVYKIIIPLINEIIEVTRPLAFHIGHDEVAGFLLKRNFLPPKSINLHGDEIMLPADLFLQDVLVLHDFLKTKGIETWMWGDMLLSPDEFPTMLQRNLHGLSLGYGNQLRLRLPRDIVICDWHYFDEQLEFPSLSTMQSEGFRVIGATWRNQLTTKNFSQYASSRSATGMMLTTWFVPGAKNINVVNDWGVISILIHDAGKQFYKDFPDAKAK